MGSPAGLLLAGGRGQYWTAGLLTLTRAFPTVCYRNRQKLKCGCQRRTLLVPVNDADPIEINTLLDASATLEEGHAKEIIQDHMVDSEKLFYEEDDAGFATSSL
nr:tumor necrosis factor receptor superfamily member 10D-like [Chlorocebus sabaeus]